MRDTTDPQTGLTPRQTRFVLEYLKDLNASQAVIRSGYSPKASTVMGAKLLRNHLVRTAVDKALAERRERTKIQADDLVRELWRIAMVDPKDLFDERGKLRPFSQIPEEVRRAICTLEVRVDQGMSTGVGGEGLKGRRGDIATLRFEKMKAFELLAQHLGLTGASAASQAEPQEVFTDEQIDAQVARIIERARARSSEPAVEPEKH